MVGVRADNAPAQFHMLWDDSYKPGISSDIGSIGVHGNAISTSSSSSSAWPRSSATANTITDGRDRTGEASHDVCEPTRATSTSSRRSQSAPPAPSSSACVSTPATLQTTPIEAKSCAGDDDNQSVSSFTLYNEDSSHEWTEPTLYPWQDFTVMFLPVLTVDDTMAPAVEPGPDAVPVDLAAESLERPPTVEMKSLLKLQKKLREIAKIESRIESGEKVDALQVAKLEKKDELMAEVTLAEEALKEEKLKHEDGAPKLQLDDGEVSTGDAHVSSPRGASLMQLPHESELGSPQSHGQMFQTQNFAFANDLATGYLVPAHDFAYAANWYYDAEMRTGDYDYDSMAHTRAEGDADQEEKFTELEEAKAQARAMCQMRVMQMQAQALADPEGGFAGWDFADIKAVASGDCREEMARRPKRRGGAKHWDETIAADGARLLSDLESGGYARTEALAAMQGWAARLSFEAAGCRAVQLALEVAEPCVVAQLASELRGHARDATQSPHANYVLQKIIEVLPPDEAGFISEELCGAGVAVARHRYGCRIFCRLLEQHGTSEESSRLIDEILEEAAGLCRHNFGHYVMQHILEHGLPGQQRKVVEALCLEAERNMRDTNGVAVVEKALAYCCNEDRELLVEALLHGGKHIYSSLVQDRLRAKYFTKVLAGIPGECSSKALGHLRLATGQAKQGKRTRKGMSSAAKEPMMVMVK